MLSEPSTRNNRRKTSWARSGTSAVLRRRTDRKRRRRFPYRAAMFATKLRLSGTLTPNPTQASSVLVLERFPWRNGYTPPLPFKASAKGELPSPAAPCAARRSLWPSPVGGPTQAGAPKCAWKGHYLTPRNIQRHSKSDSPTGLHCGGKPCLRQYSGRCQRCIACFRAGDLSHAASSRAHQNGGSTSSPILLS